MGRLEELPAMLFTVRRTVVNRLSSSVNNEQPNGTLTIAAPSMLLSKHGANLNATPHFAAVSAFCKQAILLQLSMDGGSADS